MYIARPAFSAWASTASCTVRAGRNSNDDIDAFAHFANRGVRSRVHSGSGRTHPEDSETDWYPVPLTRETLRPGTLYADPHGHLLVVARWVPQGLDDYGILIARTDPDQPKHRGITMFIVDMGAPGVEIRPIHQIDGGMHFNEIFFTDVRIPKAWQVGPLNEGWRLATSTKRLAALDTSLSILP